MPEKDNVKHSLQEMIQRIASGSCTDEEVRVFPDILGIYFERYSGSKKSRVEQFLEEGGQEAAQSVISNISNAYFPIDGLATGEQVAAFLGYGDLKNPASKIRRLANEGVIPQPVRSGSRAFQYDAAAIRAYKDRLSTERKAS